MLTGKCSPSTGKTCLKTTSNRENLPQNGKIAPSDKSPLLRPCFRRWSHWFHSALFSTQEFRMKMIVSIANIATIVCVRPLRADLRQPEKAANDKGACCTHSIGLYTRVIYATRGIRPQITCVRTVKAVCTAALLYVVFFSGLAKINSRRSNPDFFRNNVVHTFLL